MFDDLATYYHDNVVTEFVDYRRTSEDGVAGRSRDLRRALVAATALFHVREHLPDQSALSRREAELKCPDYALLGDVVNSAKHRKLTQITPHGEPLVAVAASLSEWQVLIEYMDDEGEYRHVLKTVVVKLADGTERNLLEVMTNVINFWESILCAIGVLSTARVFTYDDPYRFRRRIECNDGRIDLEVVQGQRLLQHVKLLRFNNMLGKTEPVDLSGSTLHGEVRRLDYELEVRLKHDASGQEYSKIVT